MNILHVCANPKPTEESVSKQLAAAFFTKLIELRPEAELVNVFANHPAPLASHGNRRQVIMVCQLLRHRVLLQQEKGRDPFFQQNMGQVPEKVEVGGVVDVDELHQFNASLILI